MQTTYSKSFKIEAVKKVLSRASGTPVNEVAKSLGVANTTLHGWLKAVKTKHLRDTPTSGGVDEKIPYHWSLSEKLQAIMDTAQLSEIEISEYCRKKGIFPHHIKLWKEEFTKPQADSSSELKDLRKEVKRLNSELSRKEKALAEAAALLILKKKAQELWGDSEDGSFLK